MLMGGYSGLLVTVLVELMGCLGLKHWQESMLVTMHVNHVTIPGSLTSDIINIARTSNIGIPGVWIFQVGHGMNISTYDTVVS